jgi:bacterioferritin-associated ferredoxin
VIACLCHAVSERVIRAAAEAGSSPEDIARSTGAGTTCGCCADAIARIIRERAGCRPEEARCPGCPRRSPQAGIAPREAA